MFIKFEDFSKFSNLKSVISQKNVFKRKEKVFFEAKTTALIKHQFFVQIVRILTIFVPLVLSYEQLDLQGRDFEIKRLVYQQISRGRQSPM